jgi:hypothetical protein
LAASVPRLARLLNRIESDLLPEGPDPATVVELQRVLYGLRLHFAQEDEIYHTLTDAA